MTELGAGPKLDGQFDLEIDSTGDVDGSSGSDELGKDLAVQTANVLNEDLGRISDELTALQLRDKVNDIILADSRVYAVNRLTLTAAGRNSENLRVNADVQAIGGDQQLVFEV